MKEFQHYSRQDIDEADIAAVVAVLRGDALTCGTAIVQFEQTVARYCRAAHGVAVASATAGLHLACAALGIGPGDRVWTSPNSFVASANCARYLGATVDFVDIDAGTLNLSVEALQAKLTAARASGTLPKALVVVHFAGRTAEMPAIHALSQDYGFAIIEDAAHALGARYADGTPVGHGKWSDCTVFSFHPVKPITTGEGGMVMTQRGDLHAILLRLRSHGITRDETLMTHPSEGGWYYQMLELGYHYRLTDIQAALGTSQMQRLEVFMQQRRYLARRYAEKLAALPITLPLADEGSGWHVYTVQVPHRRVVFDALKAAGIGVNVHYIPIHLQPYYRALGFNPGNFPAAEAYYTRALSLPLHQRMTDADQDAVIAALGNALKAA